MPQQIEISQLAAVLTASVLELLDQGTRTPIVLIDGRAGSGKSTLADQVQRNLFREGDSLPRVVHMDDLYDGWNGLQSGSDYMLRFVLSPISKRQKASWQQFDWNLGKRDQWREFEGGTPLIIEGCGSLSQAAADLADIKVWLEVDEAVRHDRWLNRDGHQFDEQWPIWAAQELDFYARERSREIADLVGTFSI